MDDLISRSALLAAYDKAHQGPPGGARKLIENAPGAIVRCEHCKRWDRGHDGLCPYNDIFTAPDWFCADGERSDKS